MTFFDTKQGLEFLLRSNIVLSDGTFKTAPPPFQQIYTVFGSADEWKIPVIWGLLGERSQTIYELFFSVINEKCQLFFFSQLMPEKIVTETGVIAAIKNTFQSSEQLGCWFHYSQCIYRKVQEFGLTTQYFDYQNFQNFVRMLFSLAFLPPWEIRSQFQLFKNECQYLIFLFPNVEKILDYVSHFWVFGPIGIEIWNVFDRPATFRTTNFCENWIMLWKQKIGTKNSNSWKVIRHFQENEKNSRMKILRHSQGETPAPQKKLYREYNERITRIKNSYLSGNLSVRQYWLSMAEICRKLN